MEASKDLDDAVNIVNTAVKTNPKSFASLTLRGMIYSQKKNWVQSDADFNAALVLDPSNVVVKFNISEIKFVQKQYDAARPGFLALESDPAMGDFASYKVFLCDLLGGHDDVAAKELAAFNAAATHPSYYFVAYAAWYYWSTKNRRMRGAGSRFGPPTFISRAKTSSTRPACSISAICPCLRRPRRNRTRQKLEGRSWKFGRKRPQLVSVASTFVLQPSTLIAAAGAASCATSSWIDFSSPSFSPGSSMSQTSPVGMCS